MTAFAKDATRAAANASVDMGLDAFSYGGGVQSTAALVLAARGDIDCRLFIFANVGERAEHPATLDYVERVAKPYAEVHGIELVEVRRLSRGEPQDLYDSVTDSSSSIDIPVRMSNGAPGNRRCTYDFKIRTIYGELRRRGASRAAPATLALGISVDEIHRVRSGIDPRQPAQTRVYPLVDLGLNRNDCQRIIIAAGLPIPQRSACYFCPFHSLDEWRRIKRETPALFDRSVKLERTINDRRDSIGKEHVWLTRFARPLDEAVDDQMVFDLEGIDNCESGYCLT